MKKLVPMFVLITVATFIGLFIFQEYTKYQFSKTETAE